MKILNEFLWIPVIRLIGVIFLSIIRPRRGNGKAWRQVRIKQACGFQIRHAWQIANARKVKMFQKTPRGPVKHWPAGRILAATRQADPADFQQLVDGTF